MGEAAALECADIQFRYKNAGNAVVGLGPHLSAQRGRAQASWPAPKKTTRQSQKTGAERCPEISLGRRTQAQAYNQKDIDSVIDRDLVADLLT